MKTIGSIIKVGSDLVFVPKDSNENPFYLKDLIAAKIEVYFQGWANGQMDNCELEVEPDCQTFCFSIFYSVREAHGYIAKREIPELQEFVYERQGEIPIRIVAENENRAFEIVLLKTYYKFVAKHHI
jgi:hypothetical protein